MFKLSHSARRKLGAMVSLLALMSLLLGAAPAAAQDEDPYGSTTTSTAPPGPDPTCGLSVVRGAVGASVTATIVNVPIGSTVRLLFGSAEVGRGTAEADTTVEIPFEVPDVAPGTYLVTAVGATFTAVCSPEAEGFAVLGASQSRGDGGSLPRTGVYVALLIAVAAALLLGGRMALEASRRQKRRLARQARDDAQHFATTSASSEPTSD